MQIGTFTPSKEGGWSGSIHTLTLDAKLRLVPNDDKTNDKAPTFRVLLGYSRVGDAWEAKTTGETSKTYFRLRLDDPTFIEPLNVALFPSDDGDKAALVWNRRKEG